MTFESHRFEHGVGEVAGMNSADPEGSVSIWKLNGLSWRELFRRVWYTVYEGDFLTRTAALSYYFLLALFPLLLFMTAMLGYFADRGTELRGNLLNYLGRLVPSSAYTLVYHTVDEISQNAGGGKISFGLLATIWAASYGMGAITDSLNAAYRVRETRPWWRVRLTAISLTLALAALIIGALSMIVYGGEIGETIAERLGLGTIFLVAWPLLQWPIVLACILLSFASIYYFAPDVPGHRWHLITPGSVVGLGLWIGASLLLRVYLRYFNNYSVTYGSLGAVIILMLWFYLTGAAILFGGEMNAEISRAAPVVEQKSPAKRRKRKVRPREVRVKF